MGSTSFIRDVREIVITMIVALFLFVIVAAHDAHSCQIGTTSNSQHSIDESTQ